MEKRLIFHNLLCELDFEKEEIEKSLQLFDKLAEVKEAFEIFDDVYIPYRDNHILNYEHFLFILDKVTKLSGMHRYEINWVLCVLLAAHSKYFYDAYGMPYEVYRESLMDFKWKLRETIKVYGIFGSRQDEWYKNWYYAYRFTFGRLQFELRPSTIDYSSENFDVKRGQQLVYIHIPSDSTRKFDEKNCEAAYEQAREYYEKILGKGNVIFFCASWLLLPEHSTILPETSNIRRFKESFEITQPGQTNGDLWRIFYMPELPEDFTKLPEDTSLQRAYKKFMLEGGKPGYARGFKR